MASGNNISLYVNGKFLATIEDNTYLNEGLFGFALASANTPEFTVIFDDLMYWEE